MTENRNRLHYWSKPHPEPDPLQSAYRKIEDHAREWHAGSAFALGLTQAELDALTKAHPQGLRMKGGK